MRVHVLAYKHWEGDVEVRGVFSDANLNLAEYHADLTERDPHLRAFTGGHSIATVELDDQADIHRLEAEIPELEGYRDAAMAEMEAEYAAHEEEITLGTKPPAAKNAHADLSVFPKAAEAA